jgi:Domain of unknown function (DUF4148)
VSQPASLPATLEIGMKTTASLFSLAMFSAFAINATAQTAASSPTRAEVKAEAAAANKAGKIPTGQESVVGQDMPKKPKSDTSRAAVKEETRAAVKAGTIPTGQESVPRQDMTKKPAKSDLTRAEVKDETKAAVKAGTIPTGQESVVGQDKGPPKK